MFARVRKESEDLAGRYPALLTQARRISASVVHGVHGRRRKGMGETFWEFRHADISDPVSRIDWRRSARSDELYVRETEWEAANTILFWRDGSPGMNWASQHNLPRKQDRASVLMTALAIALLKGGERCMVPGVSERPGSGLAAIERISRELILERAPVDAIAQMDRLRRARLVIASDFLDGAEIWAGHFRMFAALGLPVTLLHIADPQEEDFPFARHTKFHAPGRSEHLDLGRPEMVRAAYREKFQANRHAIAAQARQHGWSFFSHRTDQSPNNMFLALYESLQFGDGVS